MKKRLICAAVVILILTAFDQIVKHIIDTDFAVGESRPLIQGIFSLTYVQNSGAAWGSLAGKRVFLLLVTFIILCGAVFVYTRLARIGERRYTPLRVSLVFLISGAIGNMIDRITRGYVVDMFDFCLIRFPVFNVADIFVTCSFVVIVVLMLFCYRDDELEDIIGLNKNKTE